MIIGESNITYLSLKVKRSKLLSIMRDNNNAVIALIAYAAEYKRKSGRSYF